MKSEPIALPPEPTYAQSKHSENSPRPSLPAAPPKMRVNHALFWFARQKMDTPVSVLRRRRVRSCRRDEQGVRVRGDVLGDPLPDEDEAGDDPEEAHARLLHDCLLAAVQGVEELDGGHQLRVDRKGRVHQEDAHETWTPRCMNTTKRQLRKRAHTGETIADELRANQSGGSPMSSWIGDI